jgi:hypothetical protein
MKQVDAEKLLLTRMEMPRGGMSTDSVSRWMYKAILLS